MLNENMTYKSIATTLGFTVEFISKRIRSQKEYDAIQKLKNSEVSEFIPKLSKKQKANNLEINKCVILLISHMLGEEPSNVFDEDLKYIFSLVPHMMDLMISCAFQMSFMFRQRACPRNIPVRTLQLLIEFQQSVI